jgi:hypothetical protein
MRTLLAAVVVALFPQPAAQACGPIAPRAFLVAHHGGRAFAIFDRATPPEGTRWTMLAPRSYDAAATADAPDLPSDVTLTLVGPDAPAHVVSGRDLVFIRNTWDVREPRTALRIDDDHALVALRGRHTDARWVALANTTSGLRDAAAWLVRHGVRPDYVTMQKLPGTKVELVTTYSDGNALTLVRDGETLIRRIEGSPYGAVEAAGERFLLVQTDAGIATVLL